MTPVIGHYYLIVGAYWLLMLGIAALVLFKVTQYFIDDCPSSFHSAVGIVLLTAVCLYLTYDLSSYFFLLMMQDPDIGIVLPPNFSYLVWAQEPLALKWQVLELVPIARFAPIVVALIVGGIVQVFLWKVPYQLGIVVFVAQVFLDLLAMVILSMLFGLGIGVYERVTGMQRQPPAYRVEAPREGAAPEHLGHVAHRVQNRPPGKQTVWRRLNGDWESVNARLGPLYAALAPVTHHLPVPAQDFLNSGGWVLMLVGVAILALFGKRIHRRRKVFVSKMPPRLGRKRDSRANDLALIGDALTAAGPKQATVNDVPGRLRLVIAAPTAAKLGQLSPHALARLLDAAVPGLGEVAPHDSPKVETWTDVQTHDGFRRKLEQRVKFPQPSGQPSPWVIVSGELSSSGGPVFVALGFYVHRPATLRWVEVAAGHWRQVLGLRAVPEEERAVWTKG